MGVLARSTDIAFRSALDPAGLKRFSTPRLLSAAGGRRARTIRCGSAATSSCFVRVRGRARAPADRGRDLVRLRRGTASTACYERRAGARRRPARARLARRRGRRAFVVRDPDGRRIEPSHGDARRLTGASARRCSPTRPPPTAASSRSAASRASALADEHGTPLVVYCEQTIRAAARAYRAAAPDALVVYGDEGVPERRAAAAARRGGARRRRLDARGARVRAARGHRRRAARRPRQQQVRRGAARRRGGRGALVVLDALDEVERAARGRRRPRARARHAGDRGGDARGDPRPRTTARSSACRPTHALDGDRAARARRASTSPGCTCTSARSCSTPRRRASSGRLARRVRGRLPRGARLGAARGRPRRRARRSRTSRTSGRRRSPSSSARCSSGSTTPGRCTASPAARSILEPGRSLVGRAGVTLYRVGVVKRRRRSTTYVAIDGGMSDNPRPQLYGARYRRCSPTAPTRSRPARTRSPGSTASRATCSSTASQLPEPRRGDLLAVPATGAYTLAMGSNYNGVPRPAAVLVADGDGAADPPPRDDGRPARLETPAT